MVVYAGGRRGFVTGVANFDNIGVRHENQDGITIYKASDLHQRPDPSPDRRFAIDVLTAEQLAIATETRDILQPVLDGEVQGRKALGELIAPHRVNRRPKLTPCRRPKLTPCSMAADAPTQLVGIAQSGRPRIGRAMIAVR